MSSTATSKSQPSHNSEAAALRGGAGEHQGAGMKKGWQTKKLVDVATLQRGFDLPTQDRLSGDVPLVTSSGISDTHNKSAVRGPGVATGRSGSIGNVFFIQEDFWPLNTVLYVKDFHGNDPRFVFHLLNNFDLKRFASGSGVPTLNRNFVHDELVNIPPLPEQQRIVGILDEAFEGIATAKVNAEKNLQNARALFESHLHSAFTQPGKGWAGKPLGEVCEYVNGKAHEQCIDKDGRFVVINSKFISSEGEVVKRSNEALLLLQPGDIAMVLSDVPNGKALAKCFLVEEANTYTLNQRICLIRSQKFHTRFLFYQLNRNRHFLGFDNGENQTNLRLNQVLSCPLFLPPFAEQQAIADNLDVTMEETQRLEAIYERKLAALEALKKSLLHRAFAGEL